jgi:hypothetical protein
MGSCLHCMNNKVENDKDKQQSDDLTPEDLELIKYTWKLVDGRHKEFGSNMMIKFVTDISYFKLTF